jgi:hypothetical protein
MVVDGYAEAGETLPEHEQVDRGMGAEGLEHRAVVRVDVGDCSLEQNTGLATDVGTERGEGVLEQEPVKLLHPLSTVTRLGEMAFDGVEILLEMNDHPSLGRHHADAAWHAVEEHVLERASGLSHLPREPLEIFGEHCGSTIIAHGMAFLLRVW